MRGKFDVGEGGFRFVSGDGAVVEVRFNQVEQLRLTLSEPVNVGKVTTQEVVFSAGGTQDAQAAVAATSSDVAPTAASPEAEAPDSAGNIGEYVDELPEAEKAEDPLRNARIKRPLDGHEGAEVFCVGRVERIEVGSESGERLYRIRYEDGEVEHLGEYEVILYQEEGPSDPVVDADPIVQEKSTSPTLQEVYATWLPKAGAPATNQSSAGNTVATLAQDAMVVVAANGVGMLVPPMTKGRKKKRRSEPQPGPLGNGGRLRHWAAIHFARARKDKSQVARPNKKRRGSVTCSSVAGKVSALRAKRLLLSRTSKRSTPKRNCDAPSKPSRQPAPGPAGNGGRLRHWAAVHFASVRRDQSQAKRKRLAVVGSADSAVADAMGIDSNKMDDDCEYLIELSHEEKESDPLWQARVVRFLDGSDASLCEFPGIVEEIEVGQLTGERLYLIRYEDGDVEHLTSEEVELALAPEEIHRLAGPECTTGDNPSDDVIAGVVPSTDVASSRRRAKRRVAKAAGVAVKPIVVLTETGTFVIEGKRRWLRSAALRWHRVMEAPKLKRRVQVQSPWAPAPAVSKATPKALPPSVLSSAFALPKTKAKSKAMPQVPLATKAIPHARSATKAMPHAPPTSKAAPPQAIAPEAGSAPKTMEEVRSARLARLGGGATAPEPEAAPEDAVMPAADSPATLEGAAVEEMAVATDDYAALLGAALEFDMPEVSAEGAAETAPPASGVAEEGSAAPAAAEEPMASPEVEVSPPEALAAPELIADIPPEPLAGPTVVTEAEAVEEETEKGAEAGPLTTETPPAQ
jgi:hypothetical protein